jgi:hypothetical protein
MQNSNLPQFKIESLTKEHDRQSFNCGIESLDNYFKTQAGQDFRNKVAITFVLLKENIIAGYYTLSNTSIPLSDFPETVTKKLPRYPLIPATLIGRLARDLRFKKDGIGEVLLVDALKRSLTLSQQIASFAVVVDAENDAARRFYLKHKFISFAHRTDKLYLPMATIAKLSF